MQKATVGLWSRYPGQTLEVSEGADEAEAEDEQEIRERAARLRPAVVETLGDSWEELPCVEFEPAPEPRPEQRKKGKEAVTKALQQQEAISRWPFLVGRNSGVRSSPPLFRIANICAQVVQETFLANGLIPTESRDWIVQWSGPGMKPSSYRGLHEHQHVNHFPGSSELTRKDRLWQNFHEMTKTFGANAFDFVPETYVLPDQMDAFLTSWENSKRIWIVKPSAKSQGRGIYLLKDPSELPVEQNETTVVSQYVSNPMLIQGLKFDLRIYVLVTSFEPLRAYVYREGLARFASSPYSTKDEHLQDAYRHLTNYSINKGSKNFVENQNATEDNCGHKWSFSALNKHLQHVGVDVELMWTRIMDVIVKSLLSVQRSVSASTRETTVHESNCFELYGFDVLVDDNLKPWLLEVNLSPSMQAESPLDWQIKSSLLSDTFNLVGIGRADAKAIAAARLRSKLLQIRRQAYGDNDLMRTGFRHQLAEGTSSPDEPTSFDGDGQCQALLSKLDKGELKMLARSLGEATRQRNFIRLFPTKGTMERYAPHVEACSSTRRQAFGLHSPTALLAAVMLGMPLAKDEAELSTGPRPVDASNAELSAASRQLRSLALGPNAASRLTLLEYLVRVGTACKACAPSRKAAVDTDAQVSRRLQAFTASILDHVGGQLEATPKDTKGGIVVSRLWEASRVVLARLTRDAATTLARLNSEVADTAQGGGSLALVQDAPSRRALATLRTLGAKELEVMLRGSDRAEISNLLEAYADTSPRGAKQGQQSATGPLSELLLFITCTASEVGPRQPPSASPFPSAPAVTHAKKSISKAADPLGGTFTSSMTSSYGGQATALAMDTMGGTRGRFISSTQQAPHPAPRPIFGRPPSQSLLSSGKAVAGLVSSQQNHSSSCPMLPEMTKVPGLPNTKRLEKQRHQPWSISPSKSDSLPQLRIPSPLNQTVPKWPFTACTDIEL
mmetsp:Transcript_64732/g.154611  ORF Transcript_64732/g.154611 Transcript_64732/m.154611 type:complete len:958 (-) Transcript_64732:109-2982(-)|eukprot:CAMPEP_0178389916 /NCGR_PEP_ID=MMETSP0689_2-20121128/10374_1 /TAXON_ID=160604 /ORGANISM="Amphidinium massartii, Strain CS-259" /LENGTH=957 /DNA_ID=CAMNT_0020010403 /DNA_START=123 /DNA_END=2996 /DNA_ORIENTATION=-